MIDEFKGAMQGHGLEPVADERDGQLVGTDEGGGLYLLDEVCS